MTCPHCHRVITDVSLADRILWTCKHCGGQYRADGWAAFDASQPTEAELRTHRPGALGTGLSMNRKRGGRG